MTKNLHRLIVLLLVPCLYVDSVYSAVFYARSQFAADSVSHGAFQGYFFQEQALAEKLGSVVERTHDDFSSRFTRIVNSAWRAIPVSHGMMFSFPALPLGKDSPVQKPIILIAEDTPDLRQDVEWLLTKDGKFNETHEIISAVDGAEALSRFNQLKDAGRRIDLIITDLEMPEMDGNQLVAALLTAQPGMPIIFETAMPNKVEAAIRALPNVHVIRKPEIFDNLVSLVKTTLPTQIEGRRPETAQQMLGKTSTEEKIPTMITRDWIRARLQAVGRGALPCAVDILANMELPLGSEVLDIGGGSYSSGIYIPALLAGIKLTIIQTAMTEMERIREESEQYSQKGADIGGNLELITSRIEDVQIHSDSKDGVLLMNVLDAPDFSMFPSATLPLTKLHMVDKALKAVKDDGVIVISAFGRGHGDVERVVRQVMEEASYRKITLTMMPDKPVDLDSRLFDVQFFRVHKKTGEVGLEEESGKSRNDETESNRRPTNLDNRTLTAA